MNENFIIPSVIGALICWVVSMRIFKRNKRISAALAIVSIVMLFAVVFTPIPANAQQMPATPSPTPVVVQMTVEQQMEAQRAYASAFWPEQLVWPVKAYVAGGPGFPETCAGLCWDVRNMNVNDKVMLWYGPADGSEDITQSPEQFGNNTPGPLDLMRNGDVVAVLFPWMLESAQFEACALPKSTLDGVPLTQILRMPNGNLVAEGECGRGTITQGWHVVEGSINSPVAGFGVRVTANAWASMNEEQVRLYTSYWEISNTNSHVAIWRGPDGVEIFLPPSLVSAMQDFHLIDTVVFQTHQPGKVLFCNGAVLVPVELTSEDGACRIYEVPAGSFRYDAPNTVNRTSAGISWRPMTTNALALNETPIAPMVTVEPTTSG